MYSNELLTCYAAERMSSLRNRADSSRPGWRSAWGKLTARAHRTRHISGTHKTN